MTYGADDIETMLADFGVAVHVVGDPVPAETVLALVDAPDELILQSAAGQGGVMGCRRMATVKTGSLPGLDEGVQITLDGQTKYARVVTAIDDGALTVFLVSDMAPAPAPDDPDEED